MPASAIPEAPGFVNHARRLRKLSFDNQILTMSGSGMVYRPDNNYVIMMTPGKLSSVTSAQ